MPDQFFYVSLESADLEPGKPFDGMAEGEFTDMWGRDFTIDAKDFPSYVANTKTAIEHTRTEGGELVGLPIDCQGHDAGDGAGWIVDVFQETVKKPDGKKLNIIRFVANWTEIGKELIGKGIRRMFSPTLDTRAKVIVGGSLTNWPASRDDKSNILLRPIELAGRPGAYRLEADSPTLEGGTNMPDTTENPVVEGLDERIAGLVEQAVAKAFQKLELPKPEPEAPKTADDILAMLGLQDMQDDALKSIEGRLQEHFRSVQKAAEMKYLQQLSLVNRKREIAELSQRLTGGNEQTPRGLPVDAGKLAEALLALPETQVKFWSDLLGSIQRDGLTEFGELGHSKQVKGGVALPDDIAARLTSGSLSLADLSSPILAPALGDLSQYDLSQWKK